MAAEEQVDLTGRNTALDRLVTLAWRLRNQPDDISCFQRGRVFGRYGHDLFVHASRRSLTVVLSAWWSTPVAFLFSCGIYEIRSISACIKAPVAMGAKMRFALSPLSSDSRRAFGHCRRLISTSAQRLPGKGFFGCYRWGQLGHGIRTRISKQTGSGARGSPSLRSHPRWARCWERRSRSHP